MTVDAELVKVGNNIIRNQGAQLWLPDYVMPDQLNTEIPTEEEIFDQSSIQLYPIGSQLRKFDKIYRYCKAGAAMSAAGFLKGNYFLCPGSAGNSANSGFEGAFYAAVTAGDTSFSIADTAAAKNEYENAYLVVYDSTNNIFDNYTVIGNDVTNATTTKLYIASPGFKNDYTTSIGITIYRSPYMGIRAMTGGYMSALGWAKMAITSAYFFWLQTAGPISGVTGASTWPGQTQYYRDVYSNTDGSLIGYTAGYQRVGYLLSRTASDYGDNFVMLQLDQ